MLTGFASAQAPPEPPPGRLIDVAGRKVHLYCTGEGKPIVVIAGAGYSFDWTLVQVEVAKETRVCTYDASGTAWSDPAPPGLDCDTRVEELHAVLARGEIDGPYVLAGLSFGALVARLYTSEYKSDVAALVLVDHAFLPSASRVSPAPPPPGLDSAPRLIFKTPINLTAEESSDFTRLPVAAQALHRWADAQHPALPTPELAEDCLARLKEREPVEYALGNLPLAVISTANDLEEYKQLQSDLLALSHVSKRYTAAHSFHSVEIDQPETIVEAIEALLSRLRGR